MTTDRMRDRIGPRGDAPALPTLYLREMTGPWWSGVPTRCTRACGGRLLIDPPDGVESGDLFCLLCRRLVAHVKDRRRVRRRLRLEDVAPRPGRRPKRLPPMSPTEVTPCHS